MCVYEPRHESISFRIDLFRIFRYFYLIPRTNGFNSITLNNYHGIRQRFTTLAIN
ncbi:MAG: hypothetical protein WD005_06385 [Haliea sp.]